MAASTSLDFYFKDRPLNDEKRQWIQKYVSKRECVSFRAWHSRSKRDYRLFSKMSPTDVYCEVVQPQHSRSVGSNQPPKQVIRLAADTEQDVLRYLIGRVWHVPKAMFLVCIYGRHQRETEKLVSQNLRLLMATLSNPGSALVTVCGSDQQFARLVLDACQPHPGQQLPYAEIMPFICSHWAQLPQSEKDVLIQATAGGRSLDNHEFPAAAGDRGYFLLADYGVHAAPQSLRPNPPGPPRSLPRPPRASGQPDSIIKDQGDTLAHRLDVETWAKQEETKAGCGTTNAGEDEGPRPGPSEDEAPLAASAHSARATVHEEGGGEDGDGEGGRVEASTGVKRGESELQPEEDPLYENVAVTEHGSLLPAPDSGLHLHVPAAPPMAREEIEHSPLTLPYEDDSEGERDSLGRSRQATGPGDGRKQWVEYNFHFPYPLRRRLEAVLKDHTFDTESHGSVMVVCGSTSFLDLAAIQGAVLSNVPVVVIKCKEEEDGVGAMLLDMKEELDRHTATTRTDLLHDNRPVTANEEQLKRLIQKYIGRVTDLLSYQEQAFRVVRDIFAYQHLVTFCHVMDDCSHDQRDAQLLEAVVEAFLKCKTKEEAREFFRRNTLKQVASEDKDHPVRKAQERFQRATLKAAVTLDRPDILEVVSKHGFVHDYHVFRVVMSGPACTLSGTDREQLKSEDTIPYKWIRELSQVEAREIFLQRVCKLPKSVSPRELAEDQKPSTILHRMFTYAYLNGRTEMAKHFWKRTVDQVVSALVACHVSKYLADRLRGPQVLAFRQQADDWEKLAKGTLETCHRQYRGRAVAIVKEKAHAYGLTPMEAAVSFNLRSFVAEPACSDYLESVWKGKDFTAPGTKQPTCGRMPAILRAPRTTCIVSTVCYLLFLTLFGHTMVFEAQLRKLSPFDIALIVWVAAFLLEELIQAARPSPFLTGQDSVQQTWKVRLHIYFGDGWNILDDVAILLFIVGYVCRTTLPGAVAEVGHVILSLDYILFFMRLLRVMTVSRNVGPMLPMIWKMMGDLVPFLVILFVFILAYGLASEALLHPGTSWHALFLLYMPRVAFWPLFGEYNFEAIDGVDCVANSLWYTDAAGDTTCPSRVGRHVVPVVMGLYVLFGNVLMMNLLIAKFNNSYEAVRSQSDVWWAWLRCGLIREFCGLPAVPPPFSLLYRVLSCLWWATKKVCRCLYRCGTCIYRCVTCHCLVRKGSVSRNIDDDFGHYAMDVYGDVGERMLAARSAVPVHEAFREHVAVLDVLDLQQFRFSDKPDRAADPRKEFSRPPVHWDTTDDAAEDSCLSRLKEWEASRAEIHLLSLQPPSDTRPVQATNSPAGLENLTEIEEQLARLQKNMETLLARQSASRGAPSPDATTSPAETSTQL